MTPRLTAQPVEQTPLEELTGLLRDQRRRWRRWFGAVLVLVLAVGINQVRIQHVASEAQHAASKAQAAIDLSNQQKTAARLAACLSYNSDVAASVNALNDGLQSVLIDAGALSTRSSSTQRFLAEEVAQLNARKSPVRDCSPAAIDAFYARQGGTLPVPTPAPMPTTSSTDAPAPTSRPTPTSTTRPAPPTSGTTTTTVYPSSTAPTAPPTTCAVPVTVPGVPCL